jgi:DNA-binding MarR family transcriptional regulator
MRPACGPQGLFRFPTMPASANHDEIRQTHVGHWLRLALERFDQRVLELIAQHPTAPLALANLAGRRQVGAAHIHITRHLPREGARLTELAQRSGLTKQAMGTMVNQCEAWGMVTRTPDARDARAQHIGFTPAGLAWLASYEDAVATAQGEMRQAVGDEVTTVIALGLEAYSTP